MGYKYLELWIFFYYHYYVPPLFYHFGALLTLSIDTHVIFLAHHMKETYGQRRGITWMQATMQGQRNWDSFDILVILVLHSLRSTRVRGAAWLDLLDLTITSKTGRVPDTLFWSNLSFFVRSLQILILIYDVYIFSPPQLWVRPFVWSVWSWGRRWPWRHGGGGRALCRYMIRQLGRFWARLPPTDGQYATASDKLAE